MSELLDLRTFWDKCVLIWKNAFGAILFAVIAFWGGMTVERKTIVEDCKFIGTFRDGHQPYTCQAQIRIPR